MISRPSVRILIRAYNEYFRKFNDNPDYLTLESVLIRNSSKTKATRRAGAVQVEANLQQQLSDR